MLWKTSKKLAAQRCPAAENFEQLVRRVTFWGFVTGLLITFLIMGVAGYTYYRINRTVAEISEPLAPLVPLVKGITDPLQAAEKSYDMKKWSFLKEDQAEAIGKLKEKAFGEARTSVNKGRAELSNMRKYSERQAKKVESSFKKVSEWYSSQINKIKKEGILDS